VIADFGLRVPSQLFLTVAINVKVVVVDHMTLTFEDDNAPLHGVNSMPDYHLTYMQKEDRLLLYMDSNEPKVALTRRLTRSLLRTMGRALGEQKSATIGKNELVRNSVLNFEQSKATAEAHADGRVRRQLDKRTDGTVCCAATTVEVVIKGTGTTLTFKEDLESLLRLTLDRDGTYLFMSLILEIATKAEWDLDVVSWLEPGAAPEATATPAKVLH